MTDTGTGSGQEVGRIAVASEYDHSGRLVSRTDDLGNRTRYFFDAVDQLVRIEYADHQDPGPSQVVFDYDSFGRQTLVVDAAGSSVASAYDLNGRLSSRSVVPGSGVRPTTTQESFTYDGAGRIVSATNDLTAVQRGHDSLGGLVSETINGRTSLWQLGPDGAVLTGTMPSQRSFSFSYDSAGRTRGVTAGPMSVSLDFWGSSFLEQACFQAAPASCVKAKYLYDAGGRPERVTLLGGTECSEVLDDRAF